MNYNIAFALVGAVYSVIATWAVRRGGPRVLWFVCVVSIAILAMLDVYDWKRVASQEAPLVTYLVPTIVPTIVVTLAMSRLSGVKPNPFLQVAGATVTWYLLAMLSVAIAYLVS